MSAAVAERARWLRPTVRATPLVPLAVAAGAFLLAVALLDVAGTSPEPVVPLAAAAVAAALAAGLHDPAAATLAAVPTSPARRRYHRLAVLVPVAAGAWLALLAFARVTAESWSTGWTLGPLAALTCLGLAAAVWAPAASSATWGAAAPMACFGLDRFAGGAAEWSGHLFASWHTDPWVVAAAALTLILLGGRR